MVATPKTEGLSPEQQALRDRLLEDERKYQLKEVVEEAKRKAKKEADDD